MRRGKGLLALLNDAGLLGLEVRQQRLLVAVPEGRGVKFCGLAVENVLGKLAHVRRNGEVRQVAEIILGLADLIGVAQRRSEQPPCHRAPARSPARASRAPAARAPPCPCRAWPRE